VRQTPGSDAEVSGIRAISDIGTVYVGKVAEREEVVDREKLKANRVCTETKPPLTHPETPASPTNRTHRPHLDKPHTKQTSTPPSSLKRQTRCDVDGTTFDIIFGVVFSVSTRQQNFSFSFLVLLLFYI
jgi:hypothetical protein